MLPCLLYVRRRSKLLQIQRFNWNVACPLRHVSHIRLCRSGRLRKLSKGSCRLRKCLSFKQDS